jgi:hypothetical protein
MTADVVQFHRYSFTSTDLALIDRIAAFVTALGFGGYVERHTDRHQEGPGFDQLLIMLDSDPDALASFSIERWYDGRYRSFDHRGLNGGAAAEPTLIAEGRTFDEVAKLWLRTVA